jgi:hypothetical protein
MRLSVALSLLKEMVGLVDVSFSMSRWTGFVGLLLAVAAVVGGCSGGDSAHLDAESRKVASHLSDTTGVKVASGSCAADGKPGDQVCTVTTDQSKKVVVQIVHIGGKQYFNTVSGLIDGQTLIGRLTADFSRELHKQVVVSCPKVVQANVGDTTSCRVAPKGGKAHEVTVKILDDHTGDYTVVVPASKHAPDPSVPPTLKK